MPDIAGAKILHLDITDELRRRYMADLPSAVYLIRPDQVVAARWPFVDPVGIASALDKMWTGA